MVKTHDEVAAIMEQSNGPVTQHLSAFDLILENATLAQCLKTVNIIICYNFYELVIQIPFYSRSITIYVQLVY